MFTLGLFSSDYREILKINANNFQSGSRTGLRTDIRAAIPELTANNSLSYFGIH